MVDWLQVIINAVAVGFGAAIGTEIKDWLKITVKRNAEKLKRNGNK